MKKLVFLIAAVCLISGCTQYRILPPSWILPDTPDVSEIVLSETELSLEKDETYQLSVSFIPARATADLSWKSSDDAILKVSPTGTITAVAAGSATVTVSVIDNPSISATCNVSVVDIILQEGTSLAELLEEKGMENASALSLAGTLTNADFRTLREMTSLQHLDIANITNTELPEQAFREASFSTVELPENLKSIKMWAFYESSIGELDIPAGVTEIQDSAFMNCYKLKRLTIPGSVETIGSSILYSLDTTSGTFPEDIEIVEVVIDEGVKNLSYSSFGGAAIKSIKIPSTITEIPDFCFVYSLLETIELHDGITSLGECAFYFTHLHSIDLPEGLETIGADAFVGNGYSLLDQMEELVIPASVKSIGARAFSGTGISSVVFNEGLESISEVAFGNIDFTTIELPASLKSLGDSAFDQYDSIKSITFKGAPPAITYTTDVDGNLYAPGLNGIENCTVYVNPEYLEAYKQSEWFKGSDAYIEYGYQHINYFSEGNLKTIGS